MKNVYLHFVKATDLDFSHMQYALLHQVLNAATDSAVIEICYPL